MADDHTAASAPFFDIEDEYFVKADLWLISSVAITLMDLFFGVADDVSRAGRSVLDFRSDFQRTIRGLAAKSDALQAEMQTSDRFQRGMQKIARRAAALGVSDKTVGKARKATATNVAVGKRVAQRDFEALGPSRSDERSCPVICRPEARFFSVSTAPLIAHVRFIPPCAVTVLQLATGGLGGLLGAARRSSPDSLGPTGGVILSGNAHGAQAAQLGEAHDALPVLCFRRRYPTPACRRRRRRPPPPAATR